VLTAHHQFCARCCTCVVGHSCFWVRLWCQLLALEHAVSLWNISSPEVLVRADVQVCSAPAVKGAPGMGRLVNCGGQCGARCHSACLSEVWAFDMQQWI
jgi:hypothetical protein